MAELTDTDYLSIGEVLGLLLEEFPDVTISKIRFLESQGLIDPERTPSGYRKFYDADVELLRVILREQRENYLPLRVIKDRLDSGAIDPSGELAKPDDEHYPDDTNGIHVPESAVAGHPAAPRLPPSESVGPLGAESRDGDAPDPGPPPSAPPEAGGDRHHDTGDERDQSDQERDDQGDHTPATPHLLPGVVLDRDELCKMVGLTASQLHDLETYGIVTGRGSGTSTVFGGDAVEIATVAVQFLRLGVDARHLRGWRTAAEREASLFEQLITPRLRQRNPEARAEAVESLRRLEDLGGRLRAALMRTALRHHIDG